MFNEIAKNFPNIQFTWIGDGELRSELTSKNITITGWLERKDVLKELNNNDIFILTSLWEGLPISLLEAMYMKKICIVSDVIGTRDVIDNNYSGFICNSAEEFKEVISKINLYNYENIIRRAYIEILKKYNIKTECEKYNKIYIMLK